MAMGISTKIVERAAQNNYTLIITVDNGITAFEPALKAKELGIDLLLLIIISRMIMCRKHMRL